MTASQTETSGPAAGSGIPLDGRRSAGHGRWWLGTLLAVVGLVVGAVAGGALVHTADQGHAQRTLYDVQVLTTASRLLAAEEAQIALPVAQRSAGSLGDLADAVSADLGVNGAGTLRVTLGSGSSGRFTQIAYEVTVSSPYASTTFAVWVVRGAGPSGMNTRSEGSCLLSSSLLGSGRATSYLDLGSSGLQPCSPELWSARSTNTMQPHLDLAGIPQT